MAARRRALVTLTSDFGGRDSYVAEMKGALLSLVPGLTLVDLTHEIPAFDVEAGARFLGKAYRAFPPGTVHLAVVDPGVGTGRKGVIVAADGQYFVGPDNGLFSAPAERDPGHRAWEIKILHKEIAPTFHGRDVFAPCAARLASGIRPGALGTRLAALQKFGLRAPRQMANGRWEGKITDIDRFGNLATNFSAEFIRRFKHPCLRCGARKVTAIVKTFADVAPGDLGALVNSDGYLEIVAARDSARSLTGLKPGSDVLLMECGPRAHDKS